MKPSMADYYSVWRMSLLFGSSATPALQHQRCMKKAMQSRQEVKSFRRDFPFFPDFIKLYFTLYSSKFLAAAAWCTSQRYFCSDRPILLLFNEDIHHTLFALTYTDGCKMLCLLFKPELRRPMGC